MHKQFNVGIRKFEKDRKDYLCTKPSFLVRGGNASIFFETLEMGIPLLLPCFPPQKGKKKETFG